MDTDLLKTALTVERVGSFASAAREVGVDPSSISRQIAILEAALGLRLFERTTRRLSPTEAGRQYLERIGPALEAMDDAADAARDTMSEPAGPLRVTASVAFGERWLLPRVADFRRLHPKIDLELILSDGRLDLTAEGIDLGLRLGTRPTSGTMVFSKLFDTRYRVVASPEHLARFGRPARPEELGDHDGVLFRLPGFRDGWRFRRAPDTRVSEALPKPSLVISNALAVRRAAVMGQGAALLAEWTITEDLSSGRLVDLFPDHEVSAGDFDSAAWLVYSSRHYVPRRLRVFMDHLRDG